MSTYTIPPCQHIKKDGSQCGSPALRNQQFCYFHDPRRASTKDVNVFAPFPPPPFFLPLFEDASSIQRALSRICVHVLNNRLDPKKAGVLLYAAQLASSNLARGNRKKSQEDRHDNQPRSSRTLASSEALVHVRGKLRPDKNCANT
jgi:hypothetical protein